MTSARHAGRVGDFLRDPRRQLKQETRQGVRTFGTQVPCNGCDACCWHPIIKVDPGEEPPENLDHLALEPHPDGGLALKRRADGACIHLDADGCGVYEYRPRGCRVYDCRLQISTPERCVEGLLPPADPVREHGRAKTTPAPVDRGRECRDQRAGFALSRRWQTVPPARRASQIDPEPTSAQV